MEKKPFMPFENDTQSITVGEMTFENGTEEIIAYGDFTITPKTPAQELEDLIQILTTIKNSLKIAPQKKPK